MVRPLKCRRICNIPKNNVFGLKSSKDFIEMSVDEYETIRLIDLEQLTQEECSIRMNVARTTIQAIYSNARKKLADSLVNNRCLKIQGGDYKVCEFGEDVRPYLLSEEHIEVIFFEAMFRAGYNEFKRLWFLDNQKEEWKNNV